MGNPAGAVQALQGERWHGRSDGHRPGRPHADEGLARQREGPRERVRHVRRTVRGPAPAAGTHLVQGVLRNLGIWEFEIHISTFPDYPMILTATAVMSSFAW